MARHRLVLGLGVVGALAMAPGRAGAQALFDNYCITGAFSVCASVRVFTSGSTLTMQVWNLHGVYGVQHTMTAIGLYHNTGAWTGAASLSNVSYVTSSGSTDVTSYWKKKPNDINTLAGIDIEAAAGTTGNNGVVGCPPEPGGGTHWATCASFPGTPYVQFDFTLSQAFSLTDLELRWHSQQLPDGSSLKCDTGGAGDYPGCSVVPEPVTMLLLGTGLAGTGGFGLMRRRRRQGDVESA